MPADADEKRTDAIKALVRAASRYHFASLQDKHPVVAARHNAYAISAIDLLHEISDEEEVMKVTGLSLRKLRKDIIAVQDKLEMAAFKVVEELRKKGIKLPF